MNRYRGLAAGIATEATLALALVPVAMGHTAHFTTNKRAPLVSHRTNKHPAPQIHHEQLDIQGQIDIQNMALRISGLMASRSLQVSSTHNNDGHGVATVTYNLLSRIGRGHTDPGAYSFSYSGPSISSTDSSPDPSLATSVEFIQGDNSYIPGIPSIAVSYPTEDLYITRQPFTGAEVVSDYQALPNGLSNYVQATTEPQSATGQLLSRGSQTGAMNRGYKLLARAVSFKPPTANPPVFYQLPSSDIGNITRLPSQSYPRVPAASR